MSARFSRGNYSRPAFTILWGLPWTGVALRFHLKAGMPRGSTGIPSLTLVGILDGIFFFFFFLSEGKNPLAIDGEYVEILGGILWVVRTPYTTITTSTHLSL